MGDPEAGTGTPTAQESAGPQKELGDRREDGPPAAASGCVLLLFHCLCQAFGQGSGTRTPALKL